MVKMGCKKRQSCRGLFKKLNILPLISQYMYSLLMFVINNKDLFKTNLEHHNIFTRQINNLHLVQVNLTMYQKVVYYSGIRIFNSLPTDIKDISDSPVKFRTVLKHFLYSHFYTLDEYYNRFITISSGVPVVILSYGPFTIAFIVMIYKVVQI
jgi:hypothetical protein